MRSTIARKSRGTENDFMLALMRGSAGTRGVAATFVWRPGGTATDGVYVTWPTLAAALAKTPGLKQVTVDPTDGAPIITAGAWPGITDIVWVPGGDQPVEVEIAIDDGATFTGDIDRWVLDGIEMVYGGTTGPAITLDSTSVEIDLRRASQIAVTGGQPFVAAPNGGFFSFVSEASQWDEGTIHATGAAIVMRFSTGSGMVAGAVFGDGTGSLTVAIDGSCQSLFSTSQTPAPSLTVLDPQPTFVFRPGGVDGGNVFTTWAALMAATALAPNQPRTILVDDTLTAAHMTAGTWDLDNVTLLVNFGTSGAGVLIVDNGAHWTATTLTVGGGLILQGAAGLASAAWAPVGGGLFSQLIVQDDSAVSNLSATALINITDNNFSALVIDSAAIGDGTHPVFTTAVGKTSGVVTTVDSQLKAHACAGLGTTVASFDASSVVSGTQDVSTFTQTLIDNASRVAYTPATAGNWNPAPTTTKGALDQLAASNSTQASGNTGTGTATVTVTTGNITKAKNGQMRVSASALITVTGAATLTVQLKRDATSISNAQTLVLGGATSLGVSAFFVDTAPDTAAHTYTLSLSVGANAITCAANSAQIQVVEDS